MPRFNGLIRSADKQTSVHYLGKVELNAALKYCLSQFAAADYKYSVNNANPDEESHRFMHLDNTIDFWIKQHSNQSLEIVLRQSAK